MSVRLSAAICGATILFAYFSIAMARSEIRGVRSYAVNRDVYSTAVVGAASMYNPYRSGYREAAQPPQPASAITDMLGRLQSKLLCAKGLAVSVTAAGRATP
jgi:hypothetical protein